MKKVFRKIQKGTTKMIERIKSLGEMETKQKCVVQRKGGKTKRVNMWSA